LIFEEGHLIAWFAERIAIAIGIISPIIVVIAVVSVVGTLVQTGPVFSFFAIKPDLKKINPATGFKRLFSLRTLYEAGKTGLKIVLFSLVVYWTLEAIVDELSKLVTIHPYAYIAIFIDHGVVLASRMLAVLAFIALIDFVFTRKEFIKNLKMSKKEVKDEHKRQEGDPLIKSKRKELQRGLKDNAKSIAGVKDADVVVTNPTHIAIALKYDRKTMVAPKVCGVGVEIVAAKMREEARKYGVYIIENKPLARKLYKKSRVGAGIPEGSFVEVAALYRRVYALKRNGMAVRS
jgi:flagellar biosynthesis protein FlhB